VTTEASIKISVSRNEFYNIDRDGDTADKPGDDEKRYFCLMALGERKVE
jgi:hypothetical protein